ncbi:putative odorant receptor 98b [Drosophila biarmipes]|uniref:putative odorant receptor 98b n=1 Tax=Drosophila biarmipes TaxID=125945 RepID=UPI0007E71615|nr:putative odorant receptor 98b [Drosophila biarmipes]XP_016949859.1 putative odorant receptor 98b [Drosophila biarmipes]
MLTDKFLRLQSSFFRLLGLELLDKLDVNGSHRYPRRSICCILSVATFLPLTIAFGLQNIQNVDQLTDSLCSVLVDLLALCKIGFFLWLYKDFRLLIQQFHQILQRENLWAVGERIISTENHQDQFISSLYSYCFVTAGLSACLMSPLSMLVNYHRTGQLQPDLPFPSVYPWDNNRILTYSLSYLWNVSAALGVALPTVCVDTLFSSLSHNLSALFRIAREKMMHFEGRSPLETRENLVHIFTLYEECLELGNSLNGFFRPLIFAQFVAASLHLCVLCYQLSAHLLQPAMLFYFAFTAAIIGQVSIYCFCGSSVNTESQLFGQAIYESNWLQLLQENCQLVRSLEIAMMRSRRGCPINGYFFEANRQTLVMIVRSAISYVTLLRSLA